jgi:hypothetical protein
MDSIYVLTIYENSSYSFSGIDTHCLYYFKSHKGAESYAQQLGYKIVEYCKNPDTEVTIGIEILNE